MAKTRKSSNKARIGLSLALIIVLSAALLGLGIYLLPGVGGTREQTAPAITGFEYPNVNISKNAEPNQVFVIVRYSDGSARQIALSEFSVENLDTTQTGQQNASLNFGGVKQVVTFNVMDTTCVIEYKATAGGHILGQARQTVLAGRDGATVVAEPEEGYEFVKWDDGLKDAERSEKQVSESVELIANFRKISYKVVFYYDDGTIAREQMVQYGSMPANIPDPNSTFMRRYGKKFIGWDQSYEYVTKELHIHPLYDKIATDVYLDITLDDNTNSVPLGDCTVREEGYYQWNAWANIEATPRASRLFAGWSIWTHLGWIDIEGVASQSIQIYEGGDRLVFTSKLSDSALQSYNLQFMPQEGITEVRIKANFAYEQSLITFKNYSDRVGAITLPYGTPIGNHLAELEAGLDIPDGELFIGWYKDNGLGTLVEVEEQDIFTQDAELIAQYVNKFMIVTYNGEGADNANSLNKSFEVPYQGKIPDYEIPSTIPSKDNYNFMGWYLFENGQLTGQIVDGEYTVWDNIEVRPRFEVVTYTLNITTIGEGQSFNYTLGQEVLLTPGAITVDAITEYTFRFKAAVGKTISDFETNLRGLIERKGDPVNVIDYTFKPIGNVEITIQYTTSYYDIIIHNGDNINGGAVTYQDADGEIVQKTENYLGLSFPYGTSKNFFFEGDDTKYIKSITINGESISNIPRNTVEYSLPIEGLAEHLEIVVEYEVLTYLVSLPENQVNYTVFSVDGEEFYTLSSSPVFEVYAAVGYYISALRINGGAVNLFASASASDFEVNYQAISGAPSDVRITAFVLTLQDIGEDKVITVEIESIFYNVSVTTIGTGEVDSLPKPTFGYGENLNLSAHTPEGYYIKSVIVNGEEESFADRENQQTKDFTNINTDLVIEFVFSIHTYDVFFNRAGGNIGGPATVSKVGGEDKRFSATFYESAGSNLEYAIIPDEGYYISSLKIGNQDFAVDSAKREQRIEINNLSGTLVIEVGIEKIVYIIELEINNTSYGSVESESGSFTIKHGESGALLFSPETGYYLKNVELNSVNMTGQVVEGRLPLNNISGVCQVSIEFAREVYAVIVGENEYGEVSFSKSLVPSGEQIMVGVLANEGYAIDYYIVNNEVISPAAPDANFDSFYLTVDSDINISVFYKERIGQDEQTLYIKVSGNGSIYGNITSFNAQDNIYGIGVIDVAHLGIYADDGYIIESIGGEGHGGKSENWVYTGFSGGSTINIVFAKEEYEVNLNNPNNGSISANKGSVLFGEPVEFEFTPDTGYELDYFKINGFIVSQAGNSYRLNLAEEEINAEVAFKMIAYTIGISAAENGAVTTPLPYFHYGDSVAITIIPNVGFFLKSLTLGTSEGSYALTALEIDAINAADRLNKIYIVNSELARVLVEAEGELTITPVFERNTYLINISLEGGGRVVGRSALSGIVAGHGESFVIELRANSHNFIRTILVNGEAINLQDNITAGSINAITNEFTGGMYTIDVRRDYNIHIVFAEDQFKVMVASSINGVSTVGEGSSTINVKTGEDVKLTMKADTGFHIASVLINGIYVDRDDEDLFYLEDVNHLNSHYYMINNVQENISIRVVYERNTYVASVVTKNNSTNFAASDYKSEYYGSVVISGYPFREGAESAQDFYGLPHGSSFNIIITPVRNKGYRIAKFIIEWKPNISSNYQEIIPEGIDPKGGIYHFENITNDIARIYVEFERETFSLIERVTSAEGSIHTEFRNPIDATSITITGKPVETGVLYEKIEYGIQFTTFVTPPVGYSLQSFQVSGYDRLSYIRNDRYTSLVQSGIDIEAAYVINRYTFEIDDLSAPSGITKGRISVNQEGIPLENHFTAPHGTRLQIVITPNYDEEGYAIGSVLINGTRLAITNKNAQLIYDITIEENITVEVIFAINVYNITIAQPSEGGRITSTPAGNVEWGKDITLTFEIYNGYRLDELIIDGEDKFDPSIENGSTYTIYNVTKNQSITVKYVRKTYSIDFIGNFDDNNTHIEDGIRIEPYATFNGNKVEASQFNNKILLHFKPAVGYEILEWSYTIDGVVQPFDMNKFAEDPSNNNWYIYTIDALTGNCEVIVAYAIKQYVLDVFINDTSHMNYEITKGDTIVQEEDILEHFDVIAFSIQVDYGYSLFSILINNKSYAIGDNFAHCRVSYTNNNNVYSYTIILEINDDLINDIVDLVSIGLTIRQNQYAVQVNAIDAGGESTDKMIPTGGGRNYDHGSELVIGQNLSEGYSIVAVTINGLAPSVYGIDVAQAIVYNAATSSIMLTGAIVSKIDIHGSEFGANGVLVFDYVIAIDVHTVGIAQYIIETGRDANAQTNVAGTTSVSLATPGKPEISFITLEQNLASSDFFTVCTITSSVHQGARYRFSGYEEYIGSSWVKVEHNRNGITILNNAMTYTVKADRVFRAVYYRQYDIIVDLAPDYKYQSGNYIGSENRLVFSEYLTLKATANGTAVPDSELNLNNQYKFVIDCNAVLNLNYEDKIVQNGTQGMTIMHETIAQDGKKEHAIIANNITITRDMHLYAAMHNNVHFTVIQETVGSENATSGGIPSYYIKHRGSSDFDLSPTNPSNNYLQVSPFDTVKIVVPVNANYRFHGLFKMLIDEDASKTKGNLVFTDYWAEVLPTSDGIVTRTTEGGNVVYTIKVMDNSIYKVQYYKTFDISITVDYKEEHGSIIPTVTDAYDSLTGNKNEFYHNGRYDYGSAFTTIVNSGLNELAMNERYQFLGWYIRYNNGEWQNLDAHLLDRYPEAYDQTFRLVQYNEMTDRDGFQLAGVNKVEFKAVYVPIYKVTLINEYVYTTRAGDQNFYFNGGEIQLKNILYNNQRYNPTVTNSSCTNGQELTLPITGNYMNPDNYHEWLDTYLDLTAIINPTFKFVEWQYSYDGINFQRFEYQGDTSPSSEEYSVPLNKDIYIKPIYQKTVSVYLSPAVFYDAFGVRTSNTDYMDLQHPYVSINDEQFTSFPIVINFDTDITLYPGEHKGAGIDPGYDVIGWYNSDTNDNAVQPDYMGSSGSSAVTITLDDGVGGNATNVYDIECRYIKLWSITVTTYNNSASDMSDNAPRTIFDGETMYGEGTAAAKSSVTRIMRANESLPLSVNRGTANNNPKFSIENDKLLRVDNLIYEDTFNPDPDILEGYIYAMGNRTIEIIYRTYCTLTINGVMEGGVIMFTPTGGYGISDALGGDFLVQDGQYPDTTGVDGIIRLEGLDVIGMNGGTSSYYSTYGAYLKGMNAINYECLVSQGTTIDFKPGGVYRKNLTLSYAELSGSPQPFESGEGSEDYPYLIKTPAQFAGINNYYLAASTGVAGVHFKLVSSLSLGNWMPICPEAPGRIGFNGILDGNGYEITNFYLTSSTSDFTGMFKHIYNGTVTNLTIRATGTTVAAGSTNYAGVLAGRAIGGAFTNVIISGAKVSASGGVVAVMVGECLSNTVFTNCEVSNSTVTATGSYVGAFTGNLDTSIITNSRVNGVTLEGSTLVGGFAGEMRNAAEIKDSQLSGNNKIGRNNSRNIGGYVGNVAATTGKLTNNTINVTVLELLGRYHTNASDWASEGAGGFAGTNYGRIESCVITAGTVLIRASSGGGFAGINRGQITNNIMQNGTVDFALNGSTSRLGGVAGSNFGTISGMQMNKPKGGADWDMASAAVLFRMHNISFPSTSTSGRTETWTTTYLGGMVGTNEGAGSITSSVNNSKVIHARKIGDNIGAIMYLGGIVGYTVGTVNGAIFTGHLRSFNYIWADMGGLGDDEGSVGPYTREYSYLGGVAGNKAGGSMSGNSADGHTVYFLAIKYSDLKKSGGALWWAWTSYCRSDCTVRARAVTGVNGGSGDGTQTGGSVSAESQRAGSQTGGAWNFSNDSSNTAV